MVSLPIDYLSRNFPQSIFFISAAEEENINIANSFKLGKAAGHTKISMSTIKQSIHCIAAPLTHIINLSFNHGVVPKETKITRVVPIFKSGNQTLYTNYRPISVLPYFSKFLERIIYNQILLYLNNFNILHDNQYGFSRNHSTPLTLVELYDKISLALDHKEFAARVFIDLSKAFDTVNHNILTDKLQHYGIRGLALDWVKSYFSQRSQFVEYNGHRSLPEVIRCGVLQGSVLGPLFFIIYVKDLCDPYRLESILFADDTKLFISEKDPVTMNNVLNSELKKLSAWFAANKLSLNMSPFMRKGVYPNFMLRLFSQSWL